MRYKFQLLALTMFCFVLLAASAEGKPPTYNVLGARMTFEVTSVQTAGTSATIRMEIPPGGGPPAAHIHSREDETYVVMRGHFRFWHGSKVVDGLPGDVLLLPRHEPHQWLNVGTTPGEIIVTIVPGAFDRFFLEVGKRGLVMPRDRAEFMRLSSEYGIKYVPPLIKH